MRRRTILLIGGAVTVLLGAGLYGLGLLLDTGSDPGDANIGAGIAMLFGEFVGALGLAVLVAWVIAALVARMRQRNIDR
ncbi:hypothetical protein [Brevibacterium oceani]|uniref:hypothetical protein n=1 Tax=Brevibacterium oceani TaxID=358099 RepID=UPI001B342DF1|nr:hypothetical protein [Brevibacterium oceani]